MGNQVQPRTAAVLDDDPRRRDSIVAALSASGVEVVTAASQGIAGVNALQRVAPQVAFVSFEEPYARSTMTISHASLVSRVVAYTSDEAVGTYRAAIRAGAHLVLTSPPAIGDLASAFERAAPRQSALGGDAAGQVIVVTSAKGGTGKSTMAANLATTLAREHASAVLLIDFATDFGDAGFLLDLADGNSTVRAARQVARAEIAEFRESLGRHESGVFVLGAAQRFSERAAVEIHELEALLHLTTASFDHVVVDTAAVFDDALALAMATADLALVALTPDVVSVLNTRRFLRELEAEGLAPDHLVPILNATSAGPWIAPADAAEALERHTVWEVPFDRQVNRANQFGIRAGARRPSPALRSLRALADRIAIDPRHIERRTTVRSSKERFDPAYRERLLQSVAPKARRAQLVPIGEPAAVVLNGTAVVYSTAGSTGVYHTDACAAVTRIQPANRSVVPFTAAPPELRACRVCEPVETAAAA